MVFKKIEIYGFKSFADKLEVDFSGGITCIVGPNGCGKSNVADAIRWVLGEQSSKALRGTNMQDVIFKGTEKRGSLSYCEVSLFFDNTSKVFPLDYSEVVLSRKLYRSGESEYFINRSAARLKDITNLLHDSGIDRDGLTIISQGQVAEIINSKPESRRDIFEEAAGIAKFKARKVDAERKLERTEENMTRVSDVISEIERSLGPLVKQAEAAEKYLALKEKLKLLEINAYIYQYDSAAQVKAELQQQLDELSHELGEAQGELESIVEQSNSGFDEIAFLDKKAEHAREQVLHLSLGLERHSGEKKLIQEKLHLLTNQDTDLKSETRRLCEQLEAERENQSAAKKLHADLVAEREQIQAQLSQGIEDYTDKVERVAQFEKVSLERAQLIARQKTIQSLIESGEGYRFSVRKMVEVARSSDVVARNMVGVLAQLLTVPKEYESAIEVALGAAAQNIITHDEAAAKNLINVLSKENWGRATFLPLSAARPRVISDEERARVSQCVGVASELVKYPKNIKNVVESLLGRVVVCSDLESAIDLAKETRYAFKIVTLDGDVIETRGSITGGSKNALNNNLWHTNNLARIEAELLEIDKKIKSGEKLKAESVAAGERLTQYKIKAAALDSEINATSAKISALVNSILLLEKSIADKRNVMNAINKNITAARDTGISDREERAYRDNVAKLEAAKDELASVDENKEKIRGLLSELEQKRAEVTRRANSLQERSYRAEVALAKVDTDIQVMQDRVYEEYGLNYSSCYMFRDEKFDFATASLEIADLKKQIARLGPVNVNAIEDSKETKLRYDNYHEQMTDLSAAKADLEKVIKELSNEMEQKFKSDFNKINHNFQFVFKELFNGGNAKLVLTDPSDYLSSGIDIIAEPPGKKLQNISLLSGGEKALTAIAILFAILKLRPMPFCLLDEIEAALDDANVGRFAQYLQKFSATTQFIVITHRKPTMELADNLYGVTMQEKGVSKLVSVKLAQWSEAVG